MQLAKGLLSKAKEVASQTAQELQQRAQESLQRTWEQQQQRKEQLMQGHSVSAAGSSRSGGAGQQVPLQASTVTPLEVRVQRFTHELLQSPLSIENIRKLAYDGIPDVDNLRAVVWKILLGYLPPEPEQWSGVLRERRMQYQKFCEELIVDPKRDARTFSTSTPAGIAPQQTRVVMQPTVPAHLHAQVSGSDASQQAGASSGHTPEGGGSGQETSEGAPSSSSNDPLAGGSSKGSGSAAMGEDPLISSSSMAAAGSLPLQLQPVDVTKHDHPLCLDHSSVWHTYFQDSEIMVQVERDVVRTHPDMAFFTGDTVAAQLHREELKRALFLYAKLNPGLRYIQGMNELIAPLYYLFKHDPETEARKFAEADAFWCFMELISEFRDHFCAQLDNEQTGIRATIGRLMTYLQHFDAPLWKHIQITNKVDPQFYSFRWITLLLSQEFSFADVLRIWDTLLSDPHGRADCLLRVCTAMILNLADKLRNGDFTVILKTLQRYPPVDINKLLSKAASMPPVSLIVAAPYV